MKFILRLFLCMGALRVSAGEHSVAADSVVRIPYAQDLNEEMLYYVFEWGDGTVAPSSIKRSGIHGFMEHQYMSPGTYQGRFCAISVGGQQSEWTPFAVEVTGAAQESSPVIGRSGAWSSAVPKEYWERQVCELKLDGLYALDQLHINSATNFPSHFRIEYSINGGKNWYKLNTAQCFFFPNIGKKDAVFSFNGVVANAVRLLTTRMEPGKGVSIGGMKLTGSKEFLFDCSERGTTIAALNNLWYAYGSAINEVHLDYASSGQSKRPFECGVSYLGNAEWMAWDALEFSWTDADELQELRDKWLDYPMDEDGYVWACPGDPRHLFHNRHYDNNATYINGVVHYFLQTGDDDFMNHICSATELTNLHKARLAMLYQLEQLGGTNGVLTIPDPEVQGTVSSKSGNYWDYYKFGHQSAFDNAEFYRSLLSLAKLERHFENDEKAAEYEALAATVKETFNQLFWDEEAGRYVGWIDVHGVKHDFGFTFVNQHILSCGLADKKHARRVLDWLDGKRIVKGDTSVGKDIYHFGLGARANTVDMATEPGLVETWGGALDPDEEGRYGLSMQNGGSIFYTSYYDLHSRLRYEGIGNAMKRLDGIVDEFEKDELRRVPSNHVGHTLIAGVLLCFPESGIVPMFYVDGIMGITPDFNGLKIRPNLPSDWDWASVKSYWFRGKEYSIRADRAVTLPRIQKNQITVPADGTFVLTSEGIVSVMEEH
ncbi:glucosidase family protein [Tichowtungia aerotolerans]|uniref:Uncharacterized protein n=1 Tax=Tichowtungia aerotolerans TaxID=2697043 RepID=A0A6P1MCS3_9BACT|nr:hypothetical protein [Tichowtungia aerotolerans]QHI70374.1 hypothetical protein GT409_13295 [Tichowtungia aerotolerans]